MYSFSFKTNPRDERYVRIQWSFCDDCSPPKSSSDLLKKSLRTDRSANCRTQLDRRSQDRAKGIGNGVSYREEPKPTYAP